MIIDADLSSIELRVAAWLSQDTVMMEEINSGSDLHAAACVDIMELPLTDENRTDAKIFNFRMIYGGSPYSFYMDHKMPDFTQARWQQIVDNFYEKYYGLAAWHDELMVEVYKNKGVMTIPTGRKFVHALRTKLSGPLRGSQYYHKPCVVNYPVQGLAAEIIKLDMYYILKELRHLTDVKPIMQVHDSIIFDCPEKHVDKVVETCYTIFRKTPQLLRSVYGLDWNVNIDGEVSVGSTWSNVKEIKWSQQLQV